MIFIAIYIKDRWTNFSIHRGSRGPQKVGLNSRSSLFSRIEIFPGIISKRSAEKPLIILAILLNVS